MVQSDNCPVFFYIGMPECLDDDAAGPVQTVAGIKILS